MKKVNVETFRKKLVENLDDIFWEVRELKEVFYGDGTQTNEVGKVIRLYEPIVIDELVYMLVFEDEIVLFTDDKENKRFVHEDVIYFENYKNQTSLLMQLAVNIDRLIKAL